MFPSLHCNQFSSVLSRRRCHISLVCIPLSPKCFPFLNFVPSFLSLYPNTTGWVFLSHPVTLLKHHLRAYFLLPVCLSLGPSCLTKPYHVFSLIYLVFYPLLPVRSLFFPLPPSGQDRPLPALRSPSASHQRAASPLTVLFGVAAFSLETFSPAWRKPFHSPLPSVSSPLPPPGKPAVLPGPVLAGGPFPSAQGPAFLPTMFRKCWCTGCPPLHNSLIPTVNGDLSLAGISLHA